MSRGSLCSLLCITLRFNRPSSTTMLFFFFSPAVYNQFIFSNYSREGPGQRGILQQVSQKIVFVCSLASFNVILWSGSLKTDNASSPGVQYGPSFHCHRSFLVCIQPHQYFLSTLSHKRFRPMQSLLGLMVPPLLMTTAVNQSSVTCCWQIHLKSGGFFFFFSLLMGLFWCIPWTSLELIPGSAW